MSAARRAPPAAWRPALLAACALGLLAACTARQGYEGLRTGARNDCALQPAPEYQRCLERLEMDYAAYRAQPPGPVEPREAPSPAASGHPHDADATYDAGDFDDGTVAKDESDANDGQGGDNGAGGAEDPATPPRGPSAPR